MGRHRSLLACVSRGSCRRGWWFRTVNGQRSCLDRRASIRREKLARHQPRRGRPGRSPATCPGPSSSGVLTSSTSLAVLAAPIACGFSPSRTTLCVILAVVSHLGLPATFPVPSQRATRHSKTSATRPTRLLVAIGRRYPPVCPTAHLCEDVPYASDLHSGQPDSPRMFQPLHSGHRPRSVHLGFFLATRGDLRFRLIGPCLPCSNFSARPMALARAGDICSHQV